MSSDDKKREATRQYTLKTADNHRQLWTSHQDEIVLSRTINGKPTSDVDIAVAIGRTQLAVSQRRVVLNRMIESGLTLTEIHEVERWRRAEQTNVTYRIIHDRMRATCSECFCDPHIPGCPNE
jgi:hypothetical protein